MPSPGQHLNSVLITGCSAGGIGASLAAVFQKRNYLVFATARNTTKLPSSLLSLPNVVSLELDVTSPTSIAAAVVAVKEKLGDKGLDVLVNNSGMGITAPGLDTDIEQAKALFEVNFWAVLRMMQAFADMLVKAKGAVVNISSIAGETHDIYHCMYICPFVLALFGVLV
jgi:1-acylglycerone phosphate reductase